MDGFLLRPVFGRIGGSGEGQGREQGQHQWLLCEGILIRAGDSYTIIDSDLALIDLFRLRAARS